MSYNTKKTKTDVEGMPVAQVFNDTTNDYEVVKGEDGSQFVKDKAAISVLEEIKQAILETAAYENIATEALKNSLVAVEDAQSSLVTATTAEEKAAIAQDLSQQIIDGSIDVGVLNTKIQEKLASLETQYSPKLTEVTAQLATKVAQINYDADRLYFEARMNALTSKWGQSFATYEDLQTQLIENDGKLHPVIEDDNFYFWLDGYGWTSGGELNSVVLADESVGLIQTNFIKVSPNLCDNALIQLNKYVSGDGTVSTSTSFFITPEIAVNGGLTYSSTNARTITFKNAAGVYMKGSEINDVTGGIVTFQIPPGAVKMIISGIMGTQATFMVVEGTVLPTSFMQYMSGDLKGAVKISKENLHESIVEPINVTFINKSPNLCDNTLIQSGKYINGGGAISNNGSFFITPEINVVGKEVYSASSLRTAAFKNASGSFMSGSEINDTTEKSVTFIVPDGAVKMIISGFIARKDTFMLVKGSSLPSIYRPYGELSLSDLIKLGLDSFKEKFKPEHTNFINTITNLCNNSLIQSGKYMSGGGVVSTNSAWFITPEMDVESGQKYTTSSLRTATFKNAAGAYMNANAINDTTNGVVTITIPDGAVKMVISGYTGKETNYMVVKGSILPSSYLPFGSYVYMLDSSIKAEYTTEKEVKEKLVNNFEIILPTKLYLRNNGTREQYNLYFKNMILGRMPIIDVECNYGDQLEECWRFETNSANYVQPTAPFTLTVHCLDDNLNIIKSKTTTIEVVSANANPNEINNVSTGDSITNQGYYVEYIENKVTNLNTLGIMSKDDENFFREGRSGWRLDNYLNDIGITGTDKVDSPFLFPVGLEGSKYKGNVATAKRIVNGLGAGYIDPYLNKLYRGGSSSGNFIYGVEGYFLNPSIGDYMVDPALQNGSKWVEWNGSAWVPMTTQPTTFEFNFKKYMECYGAIHNNKRPTHFTLLLGANDFQGKITRPMSDFYSWIDNKLSIVINSIHSYDPNIKIILLMPPLGNDQDGWGKVEHSIGTENQYNHNLKSECLAYLNRFDNDEQRAKNIHLAPMTLFMSTIDGYDRAAEPANIYSTRQIIRSTKEHVHPNKTVGHAQMSDALIGLYEKTR